MQIHFVAGHIRHLFPLAAVETAAERSRGGSKHRRGVLPRSGDMTNPEGQLRGRVPVNFLAPVLTSKEPEERLIMRMCCTGDKPNQFSPAAVPRDGCNANKRGADLQKKKKGDLHPT